MLSILNLMDSMKLTIEQAVDVLKIPTEKQREYIQLILSCGSGCDIEEVMAALENTRNVKN